VTWQAIRLELHRTYDFPNGSAGRAYLLRLPLDPGGSIDETAMRESPERATMRRFWPNEPDCSGHVRCDGDRCICITAGDDCRCAIVSEFRREAFKEGAVVIFTGRDGTRLPFRVAKMRMLKGH
jgi:hypothetical protein